MTTGRFFAAMATALLVAGCQPEAPPSSGLAGYDPHSMETDKADCLLHGGRWGVGGVAGAYVCYRTPKDAGKACKKASDCEGLCLARSRSCAPVVPLFGCNEALDSRGQAVTVCVD